MRTRKFKWLFKLSQLAAISLIVLPFTLASTSSYFLDSSRLEIQASPQTHVASGSIKVSSNSERTIRLKVIPKLWRLNPQGVLVYSKPAENEYPLLDNIRVNPEEFELLPGKSRLVRFIVKVSPDAQDAEYPFQLYFEPTSLLEPDVKKPNVNVSNVLDVIPVFTTTVYAYQGDPKPKTSINTFACGYDAEAKQVSVDLTLNNAGSKHARVFGNAILSRQSEKEANEVLDVLHLQNASLIIVFPNTPRQIQNQMALKNNQALEAGQYQLELRLVDERNLQPAVESMCEFTVPKV
ncbi:hypothetical protein [Vampirovibrio sp.]|uniref:hypothetical protein n=1 Tax=Vampirovibrio sp. TaxID=2717857 RepID=UPI0035938D4E